MRKRRLWQYGGPMLLAALFAIPVICTVPALAETSSSANYQVTETQLGAGSSEQSCSVSYCAKASIGDTSAGTSKSSTKAAAFGTVTPDVPSLDVIVEPGVSNLGNLTTETTAFKTTTIKIRSYLSDGYTLQIVGDPPEYGNHTMSTSSSPTASKPGTEQFGINAVANTTPNVGAAPAQVPSAQTSFGAVTDDYKTANLFMYHSNDVIARSLTESGQTDYTVSMIVNISNNTPAGHFTSDFSAVVIPVY